MVETSQLIALQALLAFPPHMRPRPTLKRLVQNHGNALTNLREGDRRGPFFSPARFLAPGTTWPGMTAFDDAATLSNGAPHSRPNRLRSCSAGDILQYDVRLWPPGQIPPGASRVQRWRGNNPPSPPAPGRGPGSGARPTSPGRLVDADGFSIPPVSSPLPPPAALYCHRAHRSWTRLAHPAPGSRPQPVARDAGDGALGRYPQGARPPYHASTCSKARPTRTAHPRPPVDDETNTVVPSRRHPQ